MHQYFSEGILFIKMFLFNILLFFITFLGGSIPLWVKGMNEKGTNYLLAFSGSFLLSITLLHLLPETFEELGGHKAGLFVLIGFFVQLIIQRITHGMEHGHIHVSADHNHHHHHHHHSTVKEDHHHHNHHSRHHQKSQLPLLSILLGLSLHAFMEGLPLGFNYRMQATESALFLAVAAHKLPEAILMTTLVMSLRGKFPALVTILLFSLITPGAAILADFLGKRYFHMSSIVMWMIPVVAGAFIHIATTIFFESGTKQHMLTWQKTIAILLGVGAGLATLLFES